MKTIISTSIPLVLVANGLMTSSKTKLQLYSSEFEQFPSLVEASEQKRSKTTVHSMTKHFAPNKRNIAHRPHDHHTISK
jgi:hypothetical protein